MKHDCEHIKFKSANQIFWYCDYGFIESQQYPGELFCLEGFAGLSEMNECQRYFPTPVIRIPEKLFKMDD